MLRIEEHRLITFIPPNCQWQAVEALPLNGWRTRVYKRVTSRHCSRFVIACWVTRVLMGWSVFWTRWEPFLEQQQSGGGGRKIRSRSADGDWLRLHQLCLAVWNPNMSLPLTHQSRWSAMQTDRIIPVWCVCVCTEAIYGTHTHTWNLSRMGPRPCCWCHGRDQDGSELCWDVNRVSVRTVWGSWTGRMDPVKFADEMKSNSVRSCQNFKWLTYAWF